MEPTRDRDGRSTADTLAPTPTDTPLGGSMYSPPAAGGSVVLGSRHASMAQTPVPPIDMATSNPIKSLLSTEGSASTSVIVTGRGGGVPAVSSIPYTPVTSTPSLAANPKHLSPLPVKAAARLTNPEMERQARELAAQQFRANILISRAPARNRIDLLEGSLAQTSEGSSHGAQAHADESDWSFSVDEKTKKKGVVTVLTSLRQSLASAGLLLLAGYTPAILQANHSPKSSALVESSAVAAPSIGTSKLTSSHKAIRLQQTLLSQELPLDILRADSGINLSWVQRIIVDSVVYPLYGSAEGRTRATPSLPLLTSGITDIASPTEMDSLHMDSTHYPLIDQLLQHGTTVPITFHASGRDIPLDVLERAAKGEPIVLAKDAAGFDDVGAHTTNGKKNLLTFLTWRIRTVDRWTSSDRKPTPDLGNDEYYGAIDSPRSALVCYRHGLQIAKWNRLVAPLQDDYVATSGGQTPRRRTSDSPSPSALYNNAEAAELARESAIEAQTTATDSFLPIVEDYKRLCKVITQKYAIYKMAVATMDHLSVRVPLPSELEKEREAALVVQRQESALNRSGIRASTPEKQNSSAPSSTVSSPSKASRRLRELTSNNDSSTWAVVTASGGGSYSDSGLGPIPARPHSSIVGGSRATIPTGIRRASDKQLVAAYSGPLSPPKPRAQSTLPQNVQSQTSSSAPNLTDVNSGPKRNRSSLVMVPVTPSGLVPASTGSSLPPAQFGPRAATPIADTLQRRHDDLLIEWGKRQQVLAHDLYVERRVAKCIDDRRDERIKKAVACQTPLQIRRALDKIRLRNAEEGNSKKNSKRRHTRHFSNGSGSRARERYRPILASDSEEDEYFDESEIKDGEESVCSHSSCSVCMEREERSLLPSKASEDPLVANEKSRRNKRHTSTRPRGLSIEELTAAKATAGTTPPRSPRHVATAMVLDQQRQRERARVERMLENVRRKDQRAAVAQERKEGAIELRRAKNALITAKADEVNARLERKVLFSRLLVANKVQQQDHKDSEKRAAAEVRAKLVSADAKAKGTLADLTKDVFSSAKVQVHKALYQQEKLNADYRALNARGEYHHHASSPATQEHTKAAIRSFGSPSRPASKEAPPMKRRSNSTLGSMIMLEFGGLPPTGRARSPQQQQGKGFSSLGCSGLEDRLVVEADGGNSSPLAEVGGPSPGALSLMGASASSNSKARQDRALVVISEPSALQAISVEEANASSGPATVEEAFNQAVEGRKTTSRSALGKSLSKERSLVRRWQQLEQQLSDNHQTYTL